MVHSTRKTLEEAGDKATEEEKNAINEALAALEEVLKGDDKDAIEEKSKALSEASSGLVQKMYAEAQQQQAGASGAEDAARQDARQEGASAGDDAVDAEFEEVKEDKK